MRRLLLALSFTLAAPLPAQVAYQFVNFQTFTGATNGFDATFLVRNSGGYDAPSIVSVGNAVRLSLADRVRTFCNSAAVFGCVYNGTQLAPVGPVQRSTFTNNGSPWIANASYNFEGCVESRCPLFSFGVQSTPYVIMGCRLPSAVQLVYEYFGRTCDADGTTGAFAFGVHFSYLPRDGGFIGLTVNDLMATFDNRVFPNVVPEPSTWALLAVGLAGLVGIKRRRLS